MLKPGPVLLLLGLSVPSWASLECFKYQSTLRGEGVRYCIERTRPDLPLKNSEPVVYFMHGLGSSERGWVKDGYSQALQEVLKTETNVPAMTFVSFQTMSASFFSDFGDYPKGKYAYETWFILEFIPFIEKKHGVCFFRHCRGIMGISMGGFGAIKTALRFPNWFSVVATNSPALINLNPHDNTWEWIKYFVSHPMTRFTGMPLLFTTRLIFQTRKSYEKNDPFLLVSKFKNKEMFPAFYFDVGSNDHYGFQEGFLKFVEILEQRELPFEAHMVKAGHYDVHGQPHLLKFIFRHFKNQDYWASIP